MALDTVAIPFWEGPLDTVAFWEDTVDIPFWEGTVDIPFWEGTVEILFWDSVQWPSGKVHGISPSGKVLLVQWKVHWISPSGKVLLVQGTVDTGKVLLPFQKVLMVQWLSPSGKVLLVVAFSEGPHGAVAIPF